MRKYQNLHSHTKYCDGKLSVEGMVRAAIDKGGSSIGFSEHSYLPFEDELYSLTPEKTQQYLDEVKAAREKYSGQIEVYLGIERDYYTTNVPDGLDFVIGSVHFVKKDGQYITIDNHLEKLQQMRDEHFGGDFITLTELYWETVAGVAEETNADIIGHFDIVTKQNECGRLFDETDPRYVKAALAAMDRVLEGCKLFEINTGAMYRVGRSMQYPSQFLLRELCRRGGEIILTSDSHDGASLFHKFDEMRALAKSCGFKHIKKLTKNGFVNEKL